jgi:hypothetical protein
MKFLALIATARAAIHADCTKTWKDAADAACDGAGEICFDWLNEAKDTSLGLFCGLKSDCGTAFKYTGGGDTMFYAQCDGLSMADCGTDKKGCDSVGQYKCADWTAADGTVTMGCAGPSECGTTVNAMTVACTGLAGDACMMDSECDKNAKYRCGMEFNNQTYTFSKNATAMCTAGDSCGKKTGANDSTNIMLCYNDVNVKCDNTTTCDKPDGDEGDVICGYIAVNGTNMTSGMCVDKAYCPANALNGTGANVKYFGADTMIWCGSARTALAMGAAAISAYLAM